MAQDGMMESLDERILKETESEESRANEGQIQEQAPAIPPPTAANLLSGKMGGIQRQAIVQNVGQNFGNKQVQRMIETLRRSTAETEDETRRSASSGREGGPMESDIASRIQSERSNGQQLDSSLRREVESKLGADLSPVRVHTSSASAELNRQVGAKAFTTGRDIFFGSGHSPSDKDLLTHEATHTIQQGFSESAPSSIGAADTEHEHEAEHNATNSVAAAGPGVQREGEEDEMAMSRDPNASIQREGEEDEMAMSRDPNASIQREGEEDEMAMSRDPNASIQREGEEDEMAMSRDPNASIQREGEEDEMAMSRDLNAVQRESSEEESEES